MNERDDLKIVTIDCPYDTFHDPFTQEIFAKTINLKITGYRKEYPYGILPVDATDFVANHQVVCQESNGELFPVMAYRSITLERCRTHNLLFPLLHHMKIVQASEHERAIQSVMDRCERENTALSFDSSFTIHPDARTTPELLGRLRDIMMGIHVLYHTDYQVPEVLAGGVLRFKMERLYQYWGYNGLSLNDKVLEPLSLSFMFDEKTTLFHLEKFSDQALANAEKHRSLWESRIVLSGGSKNIRAA